MATESNLIRDGANCVAAANYGNNQSLAGPSGSGQFLWVILSQSADRAAILNSAAGAQAYGVLLNKPASGEVCDVAIFGVTKAVVAAAGVTRGKPQMATATGATTDWTAGSGYAQLGVALESGSSGAIVPVFVWGTPAKVLT